MIKNKKDSQRKTPWPTLPVMQQIYKQQLWGSNGQRFYSGEGSHNSLIVEEYISGVVKFLTSFETLPVVNDLGCGDFNVGKQLLHFSSKYNAIDIVPELISFHKENYEVPKLEFHCLDIASENLPQADVVILRQVLQHLSNKEIAQIVEKLYNYKYVILTEHLPSTVFVPNIDIISGQGIRLKKQSGVDIIASPFHFKVVNSHELCRQDLKNNQGEIVTTIYEVGNTTS